MTYTGSVVEPLLDLTDEGEPAPRTPDRLTVSHRLQPPRWLAKALGILIATVAASSTVWADSARGLWEALPDQASRCATGLNDSLSRGADCVFATGVDWLLGEGAQRLREYGGRAFGEHFQVVAQPGVTSISDGVQLSGKLDVVIPFAGLAAWVPSLPLDSALFLQQGLTRWWDASGALHNDLRQGLVYRFRLTDRTDSDVLGMSLLVQHNLELNHEVLVSGIDYTGRFGNAAFRYYHPLTGWRTNHLGRAEKALAGAEFETRIDLSTTLRMRATGYHRESEDGLRRWSEGVRMGIGWRPHPWLKLRGDYDYGSEDTAGLSAHAGISIPLSSLAESMHWEGLGRAVRASLTSESQLWRPVEAGRIRVATQVDVAGLDAPVEIYFLQEDAASGDTVELEIALSSAAQTNTHLEVRLVPGSGSNPAVSGEDFVDEPAQVTIPQGETSARVSFQLLYNPAQQENRSLSATVSLVS